MKRDFPALWAEAPATQRREPTNGEMASGFPCGPADLTLFNELIYRLAQAYREISYCITQSGQTPNANNLTQLWTAIQASSPSIERVHSGVDTGTAGHIVANVSPDIAGYDLGNLFLIKAANAATGVTDVNLDSRGIVALLRADGTPTQKGDWLASEVLQIVSDGENLRLFGVRSSLMPSRRLSSFQTAGTYTFVVPAGVTWIFAECVGAGGGGSGGGGSATWASGGGGSGGYASGWISVEPNQSITVIVGAKGLGTNNANGAVGGAGGTSSVGAFFQATGGSGGRGSNTDCSGGTPVSALARTPSARSTAPTAVTAIRTATTCKAATARPPRSAAAVEPQPSTTR
ncbi:glycine-rich domain-containing protein [Methylorubrum suomiense]